MKNGCFVKIKQVSATFSIETRQTVATLATHPHFLAWHPAGRFIVTRFQQEQIGLIDLEAGKVVKTLYFGAICDWSHLSEIFSGTLEKAGLSEAQLVGMKKGIRSADPLNLSIATSPDGRLLFCATTRGMCVLEWDKVLAAEKTTPAPLCAAAPMPLESPMKPVEQKDYQNYVYDVDYDEKQNRLLSGRH